MAGRILGKDNFEMFGGIKISFYDRASIEEEFGRSGLFEIFEVNENYPFYLIECKRQDKELTEQKVAHDDTR